MAIDMFFIPLAILSSVLWLIWSKFRDAKRYPPGPFGLPLLGYVPFLGPPHKIHEKFMELSKTYGNVLCISMATKPVVILNDFQSVHEAFVKQANVFNGRPKGVILEAIFNRKDIASADGPIWHEQRIFALNRIRNFGFGNLSCQSIVAKEAEKLISRIAQNSGKSLDTSNLFFTSLGNYVWAMCAAQTFQPTDPEVKTFGKAFYDLMAGMGSGGAINFIPWLRSLPFGGCGFKQIMDHTKTVTSYIKEQIEKHVETLDEHQDRDFIDQYLRENIQKSQKLGYEAPPYNKESMVGTLFDFFLGSIQTTDATLRWGLLLMAYHPHVQKNVQEELDRIVGPDATPTMDIKPRLPYTEATFLEISRFQTVAPLAVPHATLDDTVLLGHSIPKDTMVLANLWAIHHDPNLWGDPENFRPERFLDKDGVVQHPPYHIPWSIGPRSCLGGPVARLQAFILFSSLLHKLDIDFVPGEAKPSLDDSVPGLVLLPKPFNLKLTLRL
ncbi:Cytochrome P450 30008A2 [Chamberlinius hualienensis]